jgi:hypothetical protein
MIWESSYWKDDLLKAASDLRRRRKQKRWVEASFARLEQRIMLGFYGVRKLLESRKISDRLRHRSVPLDEFIPTGKTITPLNRIAIDEIYKIDASCAMKKSLKFVCHQIIHSYVFTLGFNEEGYLEDLFFASDHQKDQGMFCIKIDEIVSIFEEVGSNDPVYFSMTRGQQGGRTTVIQVKVD